jgi:molybdopterin-guanine dinucleotide biosynthesis protein A
MTTVVPSPASPVWGCVLIGGRSRRMGSRPKHLIRQEGCSWAERTVAVLLQTVEQVVIAGQGVLPTSLTALPRVADIAGLGGPLAGILAAFRAYPGVSWLVTACDQPDIEEEALRWLLACRQAGILAVMPDLHNDGRIEPLLAYYDQQCGHLLEEMAASGQRRMSSLRHATCVITPQPPEIIRPCWRNINTPEDLAAHPAAMLCSFPEAC